LATSLPAGVRQRVAAPTYGMDVWRTVTVYQNGKALHRHTYDSHYSGITGVLLIGKAAAAAN
jgi:hypothetical protein